MIIRPILITLFCLGLLLLTGCTPTLESVATVPATRPAATNTAPAPEATAPPNTPFPQATLIPTVTPTLPAADLQATHTALAAAYTPPPTDTPTPTSTPSPTFTPIPGPVWPILFAGGPCVDSDSACDRDAIREWGWYQIASDGSGLKPVPQLNTHPELRIQDIRFSPDGSAMAYWAWSEQGYGLFLADLDNSNPVELVSTPFEESAWMRGFDFMPGTNCLVLWWADINKATEVESVSVEQVCPGQPEAQVLDVVELPFGSGNFLMSPQGDAFLALSQDRDYNWHLSVDKLGDEASPRLLFTAPAQEGLSLGPVYWQPDGQEIEFIQNVIHPGPTVSLTHYVVSDDGQNMETRLELTTEFVLVTGGWSQDGREIAFFSGMFDHKPEKTGIYIFDLESGTWRQILAGYYLTRWPAWSPELP